MTKKNIASHLREDLSNLSEMTYKFNQRLLFAYKREQERRAAAGEKRITYTEVWKAAGVSSGAATNWFDGTNGMALENCVAVTEVLRCNPFWLYDGSMGIDDKLVPSSYVQTLKSGAYSTPCSAIRTEHIQCKYLTSGPRPSPLRRSCSP